MDLNKRSWKIVESMLDELDTLGCTAERRACGALVVDAGVKACGGYQAGLRMAEASTSGLASARLSMGVLDGLPWPYVDLLSDHPALGCFACQSANWSVDMPGLRGMGSGPACILAFPGKFPDLAKAADCAVLVLEAPALPGEAACKTIAKTCGVAPGRLAVLAAPTSSLAGSTQIAARSIETALHKLAYLGFDLHTVASGMGRCPVAQPTGDDTLSLGKTNDAMTFGSQVWLSVTGTSDAELSKLAAAVPASTSPSYGRPFSETLVEFGGFYTIDPGLFAPAEIILANLDTGHIHPAGARDEEHLRAALCRRGG